MSNIENLLNKFKDGTQTWSDYQEFLKLEPEFLEPFLKYAYNLKIRNFGNILKIYIPNKKFPAISITGNDCALECEHCNKKYLNGMKAILNNTDLERYLMDLSKKGGVGALISGGCEPDGSVPLIGFLDTIKKVKTDTNLIINTHTGLLNRDTVKKLVESKIDIVSFDVNMDEEIIKDIYHLNRGLNDYKQAINLLKKYKLNIVPHICIGLYYGRIHKELESIKFIKKSGINPSLIVLIVLIPPKKSRKYFINTKPSDIAKILTLTRFIFPNTEISLGCMRPRGEIRIEIEKLAIQSGINRIEIPSNKTLKWVKEESPDLNFKFFSACCAIPEKFENLAQSKESDLTQYRFLKKN